MKRTHIMVVLAGVAILAIAMLHFNSSLQHWANFPTKSCQTSPLVADGGEPVPPWPGGQALNVSNKSLTTRIVLADGGEPVPPWPSGGLTAIGPRPMLNS